MDEIRNKSADPWFDGSYETGPTRPPKKRGGMLSVLLILVILLCGATSALGVLNARIFQQLSVGSDEYTEISFSVPQEREGEVSAGSSGHANIVDSDGVSMEIADTPLSVPNQPDPEGAMSWQDAYDKNIDSVVSITCFKADGTSAGTGVIFSQDGYIVTNSHVVADAVEITVLLSDDRRYSARIVGCDAISDLAVLRIDASGLTAAEFGNSASVRVGDAVVAIGDPLGVELRGTMTDGIISAINRDISVNGRTMTLLQTNAALNSGNSGGPLINCYGQVIGINTMKIGTFSDQAGVEGLGFAIPSATVKEIVDQLVANGFVSGRPTLGLQVEELSLQQKYYYRLPDGLYISHVDRSGPAGRAGIQKGDMLLSIDGTGVYTAEEFNRILYSHQVGDSVKVVIYRSGKQYSVILTLEEAQG